MDLVTLLVIGGIALYLFTKPKATVEPEPAKVSVMTPEDMQVRLVTDHRDRDDALELASLLPGLGLNHQVPIIQAIAVGNSKKLTAAVERLWELTTAPDGNKLSYLKGIRGELDRAIALLEAKKSDEIPQ